MEFDLVKFVPGEVRLEIAQRVIEESGIRPLAREIDIDPKSVYKYKNGSAKPGDRVTTRLFAVLKRDYPQLMEEYLERLNESFNEAINSQINPAEILPHAEKESKASGKSVVQKPTKPTEKSVDQEPSGKEKGEGVAREATGAEGPGAVDRGATANGKKEGVSDVKETEGPSRSTTEISFDNVCSRIGVANPFNQRKVQKIIDSFEEESELEFSEIVEYTGLSSEALEKYLEDLTDEGIFERTGEGSYRILVEVK